jgi:hypothetical protein
MRLPHPPAAEDHALLHDGRGVEVDLGDDVRDLRHLPPPIDGIAAGVRERVDEQERPRAAALERAKEVGRRIRRRGRGADKRAELHVPVDGPGAAVPERLRDRHPGGRCDDPRPREDGVAEADRSLRVVDPERLRFRQPAGSRPEGSGALGEGSSRGGTGTHAKRAS